MLIGVIKKPGDTTLIQVNGRMYQERLKRREGMSLMIIRDIMVW